MSFNIKSWAAIAPGLEQVQDWQRWLQNRQPVTTTYNSPALKQLPPLLRRRLNPLGKYVVAAILQLLKKDDFMPSVFASRHGDTALTFSLLQAMGRGELLSPKSFSLAVHNAISGLYSIARKETSAITAIAATEGLLIQALIEAASLLQIADSVLCVIYDAPLPELYHDYCPSAPFPYAIAIILHRSQGQTYILQACKTELFNELADESISDEDALQSLRFLELLTALSSQMIIPANGTMWSIKKAEG